MASSEGINHPCYPYLDPGSRRLTRILSEDLIPFRYFEIRKWNVYVRTEELHRESRSGYYTARLERGVPKVLFVENCPEPLKEWHRIPEPTEGLYLVGWFKSLAEWKKIIPFLTDGVAEYYFFGTWCKRRESDGHREYFQAYRFHNDTYPKDDLPDGSRAEPVWHYDNLVIREFFYHDRYNLLFPQFISSRLIRTLLFNPRYYRKLPDYSKTMKYLRKNYCKAYRSALTYEKKYQDFFGMIGKSPEPVYQDLIGMLQGHPDPTKVLSRMVPLLGGDPCELYACFTAKGGSTKSARKS